MKYIKSINDIKIKLNYILTMQQKRTGLLVVSLVIIGSFLDTLGVSAILPFVESVLSPGDMFDKWYARLLIRVFDITNQTSLTICIGMCIILIYLLKNAYLYFSTMFHTVYRSKIQKELSTKMLKSYMNRNYEFYTGINTAEIQRGIGTDVTGIYNFMDNLFRFFGELLTAILIAVFLLVTDAFMAICIVIIAGGCFGLITLGLKKKTKYYGELNRITDKERTSCALQAIGGFKEIKASQTTDYFLDAYNSAYERQRAATVKNEYIINLPERLIETVCVAVLLGIVCVKIAIGTDMSSFIPKLSVFAVAAFRLLPSISRMTRYMNGIIFNNVFLQSVYTNLFEINQYEEEQKIGNEISIYPTLESSAKIQFLHSLEVKDISWHYSSSSKEILQNLSLSIKKGEAIGLVGASGAGKTTLADILLGLLKPQKGQVLVDDVSIFENPKTWCNIVGYVPQNIYLLDDTIRKNVAFGCPADSINDERVWQVLKEAQLDDFVRNLPEQLDTPMGERGIKFSGGQRQRIAIARALYINPDIIILDEATSALDNETEEAVMESIDALHGQKTLIIVAHRLSTIKQCDKIYEITDGKAVLRKYDELYGNS